MNNPGEAFEINQVIQIDNAILKNDCCFIYFSLFKMHTLLLDTKMDYHIFLNHSVFLYT